MSDAIAAAAGTLRTLVDGTVRLQCDIEPRDAQAAMALFGQPGTPMALAALKPGLHGPVTDAPAVKGQYGQQAKALKLSGFMLRPDVWAAVGTDAQFLAWLKEQPCAAEKRFSGCDGDIVAAHVRRVVNGSGMGVKPKHSAIPLCVQHHSQQHQHGESALGGREWFDEQRVKHLERWAWETLRGQFNAESMADVPPDLIGGWAGMNNLAHHLPEAYR